MLQLQALEYGQELASKNKFINIIKKKGVEKNGYVVLLITLSLQEKRCGYTQTDMSKKIAY